MADTKISALTELAATPADGDWLPIVDVSDTTMAASGTTKKWDAGRLLDRSGNTTGGTSAVQTFSNGVRTSLIDTGSGGITLDPANLEVDIDGFLNLTSTGFIKINGYTSSSSNYPKIFLYRSRGSVGGETAVQSGDLLGALAFRGHDGSDYDTVSSVEIRSLARENFGTANRGASLGFYFVGTASTANPAQAALMTNENFALKFNGNALTVGDSTNTNTYISIAGSRAFVGYESTTGNIVLQSGASKGLRLQVNSGTFDSGVNALTINSGGTVTIGTATIGTLGGSVNAGGYQIGNIGAVAIGTASTGQLIEIVGSLGSMALDTTGATWAMSRASNNYIKASSSGGAIAFVANGAANSGANSSIFCGTVSQRVGIAGQSSPSYELDVNGAAHASSFPTSSDARLKENIRPFVLTPTIKQRLNMVSAYLFEWRDDYAAVDAFRRGDGVTKDTQIGFIAQEVGSAVPQLVTRWRHAKRGIDPVTGEDIETNVIPDALAVDYARFIPILWEAAKDLYGEVATLKQRVTALGG